MSRLAKGVGTLGLLLAAQVGFTLSGSYPIASAVSLGRSCGKTVLVRNYLDPLDRLPKVHEPPAGRLAFAPPAIRLTATEDRLVAGGGSLGFSVENRGGKEARDLDWIVEFELVKVDRKGKPTSALRTKRRRITTLRGDSVRRLLFSVSGTPALYRSDIRFQDLDSGRILGAFSSYVRVVRKRVQLRMEIERSSVLAGEYARATLMNPGTVPIEFGSWNYGFSVEELSEGKWQRVAPNPPLRVPKLLRDSYVLPAGAEVAGCLRYLVPTEQPPALFRFTSIGRYGQEWTNLVSAQFEVAAP